MSSILIGPSDKQLASINDRLLGIEEAIKGLSTVQSGQPQTGTTAVSERLASIHVAESSSPSISSPSTSTPSHFEGESSFLRQTLRATQAQELTSAGASRLSEVAEALRSLRALIGGQVALGNNNSVRFGAGGKPNEPLPMRLLPASVVLKLLGKMKGWFTILLTDSLQLTVVFYSKDAPLSSSDWGQI